MTIGKNSGRSSVRAPKFLDKSTGFYGRLDEPEAAGQGEEARGGEGVEEACNRTGDSGRDGSVVHVSGAGEREEVEAFDLEEGMMEDDGETLLQRKPSRRSGRWRRSSRRKQKVGRGEEGESPVDPPAPEDTRGMVPDEMAEVKETEEEEEEKAGRGKEPEVVHFPIREDTDDQVLIRDKKRGREEEGEEERRMKREQEEGMRVVKRNSVRNYRKALDRAFRRGWEAFIANLYSVTLTPVTSSSPPSSSPSLKKKVQHNSVLAEFQ
uniref:cilia- and flagella-associated protein 251 n=1 Tax=Gasterosteus aculeatus aculeatus TaxID=481459 RepID=UPI001A98A886|nr:cilia- and flagella-associated protein 251 [Gasterosteus aculeatus aculeatus]